MKYLILFSFLTLSCVTPSKIRKNTYQIYNIYNDSDYTTSFYNLETKNHKKATLYDDSGKYNIGDKFIIIKKSTHH